MNLNMLTVHCDDEQGLLPSFPAEARDRGIRIEITPPYQPEQNGYAERYGALISSMARQLLNDAGLPSHLWHEAARTATYIQNRIPHRPLGWKSPCQALAEYLGDNTPHWLQMKPDLSNIRVFGCKAYVRINKIARLDKTSPRAAIGYLVRYDASNI